MNNWEAVWTELREALMLLRQEGHAVLTLARKVPNHIIQADEDGIVIRSEKTGRKDFIEAQRFQIWWNHLQNFGSASLMPGDPNNPHRWRSCVVGAIWVQCLPHRIEQNPSRRNEIRLKQI